ncbi:MAG TPA: PSD1 and planctomycete cytochrome C domain-containing protein, partial [Tepidisphaeraceae bacterium]|nr:PSD1 and planctomycete cytochrome C domain-containing protein [Tepidisphaeraceae bacterium]
IDFDQQIRPILQRSCIKCHGPEKQKGGLRLDRPKEAFGSLDSGKQAITPSKPDQSELIHRITTTDPDDRMPPKSDPLTATEIQLLRAWIAQGATWPESKIAVPTTRPEMVVTAEDRQHWSYLPLRSGPIPQVKDTSWAKTTIDRFILSTLESKNLRPNPPADRRTLIRRVYFDMLGLPPSPEEVDAFVADPSPDAYLKLVDYILANSHYGERWGRHWLDVARYADSDGLETDADRPNAFHYRDFVIRALNDDLSYQTFVRWQLAGDEYEPENPLAVSATGFLTAAPSQVLTVPMEEEKQRLRFNELDDMAATTASAFLGLTLGCARCHDHKFDAIPTRDYYRIQCAFTTTARDDVLLTTRQEAKIYRDLESQWSTRQKAAQKQLADWLAAEKKAHPESAKLSDDAFRKTFTDDQRTHWGSLKKSLDDVNRSQPPRPPAALAITDTNPQPQPTYLLDRGNFNVKKEPLQIGFLTVLTGHRQPEEYWSSARQHVPIDRSTAQRRALADWITDPDNGAGALLARVIVNRIWQHHFGEGLVRTVSDFGVRGEKPTHPELLEFLSHQFVANGWHLKSLHRLILTSSVYMQSDTFQSAIAQIDPDNRLLSRRRSQRLESEILRDTILAVSGALNPQQFGPAFKPPIAPEAMQARNTKDPYPKDARDTPATRRRTVYMFHKRVVQHPFMQAFDGPDASLSCGRRANTTVAPQALELLNDIFIRDRAADFAKRLLAENATKTDDYVTSAFRLALSRPPTDTELQSSIAFFDRQLQRRQERDKSLSPDENKLRALTDFCQALFGLNEFIYVD